MSDSAPKKNRKSQKHTTLRNQLDRQIKNQLERQLNCRSKSKRASNKKRRPDNTNIQPSSLEPRPPNLPLWAPDDVDLNVVPQEVQQAVAELVQPLYNQFVIGAADALEKSIGVTISHLLWLEILEQFDIKREYIKIDALLKIPGNRHDTIDRHLRLIDSKLRVGYFLVRIREHKNRIQHGDHPNFPPEGQTNYTGGQTFLSAANENATIPQNAPNNHSANLPIDIPTIQPLPIENQPSIPLDPSCPSCTSW
jgi:hypothetical protein